MIVVQVRPDLSFEVIDREKEMVRLGAGGLDGRALTPEAMHAALQVLSKFRRLAESHRVDEVIAVATSATREAENGGEFLQTVTQQTGIRPAGHLRHRGSPAHPSGRGLRRQRPGRRRGRHRHRRRQRRDHARRRVRRRAGPQLQARRHPSDRALRQDRSARAARRAQAGAAHRRRDRQLPRPDRARRIRARDRHVGHDPQPRRGRVGGRTAWRRARRCATAASPPSRSAASARSWSRSTSRSGCACRGSSRGAPTSPSPARSCSTIIAAPARRHRDHALRSVAARRAGARLHRAAPQGDRAGRPLSRRPPPQRLRARRALQLLAGARAAGRAARDRRCSIRRARSTASPIASASGSNTPRSCTTSASTSATRGTTSTRTT